MSDDNAMDEATLIGAAEGIALRDGTRNLRYIVGALYRDHVAVLRDAATRLATLTRERDEAVAESMSWQRAAISAGNAADQLQRDLASARTALAEARGLLNPSILRCVNFHHAKKDRHEAGVECPCEVRAFALLARIDALVGEGGA